MLRNGDVADPGHVRRLERFAEIAEPDSPLIAFLARTAAGDPVCHEILDRVPTTIPAANVLLAAVQYLLLQGADPALAAHYPSPGGGTPRGDVADLFLRFCADHRHELIDLVATRGVQTNEVRRCVALVPAFATVAEAEHRPLALIEVGPSAGLNLCFDRYRYDYGFAATGPASSGLVLDTEVRGARPPIPSMLPPVAWRRGIDLSPIDLADPDAVLWARALLWPDQIERIARFEAAVAIVRPDPPTIITGDAVTEIGSLVAAAPPDAAIVVYHSFALNQFTDRARRAYDAALRAASRERTIHEIAIGDRPWRSDSPEILHITHDDGETAERTLGSMHHHGSWLAWAS